MPLDPSRTVAELRELQELTGDENGAQRVASWLVGAAQRSSAGIENALFYDPATRVVTRGGRVQETINIVRAHSGMASASGSVLPNKNFAWK